MGIFNVKPLSLLQIYSRYTNFWLPWDIVWFHIFLEIVTYFNHVQIQTRVRVVENKIGHVLEAIANNKMPDKIKINSYVRGKLDWSSEVFIPEGMLADYRRINAHQNADSVFESGKIKSGPDRSHEG